jgi:hypothetical protein
MEYILKYYTYKPGELWEFMEIALHDSENQKSGNIAGLDSFI